MTTLEGELERRVSKYLVNVKGALDQIDAQEIEEGARGVIETTKRYLSDAEYYKSRDLVSSLATVAYCEGLLDALRLLGLVRFEWR